MTDEEKKRLAELTAIKKQRKLDNAEFAEFKKLSKMFKGNKSPNGDKPQFMPGNDFSWWNKVPELLRDSANLKSNWIAGTSLAGNDIPFVPMGAIRFELASTYGINKTATDPINVWARDLFLRMFQKWRGISAYSASDLAIAIMAGIEFVKGVARAERIYGIINRYSKRNVNMPHTEAAALGLSTIQVEYIRNHLSDYRYDLNVLIRRAQRLCIPKDISAIANALSLSGYEYLDHENAKAQLIIFDYVYLGVFSDTNMVSGGSIEFTNATMPAFLNIVDDTKNMFPLLETMLDALLGSDGIQKIFGDLVTWFGDEQLLTLLPLPEDYTVVPTYSESILHKMHNIEISSKLGMLSTVVSTLLDAADQTYLQSVTPGGYVIYQMDDKVQTALSLRDFQLSNSWETVGNTKINTSTNATYVIRGAHIIDTYRVDPTDEVVVEGALWKPVIGPDTTVNSKHYRLVESCSFEIVLSFTAYRLNNGVPTAVITNESNVGSSSNISANAAELAVVDWAPLVYQVQSSGVIVYVWGDIDTPIPVYSNDLTRLHTSCIYSGLHTDIHVIVSR